MDNPEEILKNPCYIGTTKFMAGIFLSLDIAKDEPYFDSLCLKKFADFATAFQVFSNRYGQYIQMEDFRVNKLYEFRDRHIYAAICCLEGAAIVETELLPEIFFSLLGRKINLCEDRIDDELTYDEAEEKVKKWLSEGIGKFPVYMAGHVRVNKLITHEEAWKRT